MKPIRLAWLTTDTDRIRLTKKEPTDLLQVPDLRAYRHPLAKARVLLDSAAQVEHMLLVQYLYAAMTLKTGSSLEKLPRLRRELVRSWRATLTDIAVEEMGHLMSVQNLRLFIGAPVTFERERFPSPIHSIYPFELRLEPLSFGSLSKYILAEAPANKEDELQEYVKAARLRDGVRHVGIIYALLSILFSPPNFLKAAERDFWDKFVRAVAYAAPHGGGPPPADDPDNWHVDHSELHPESLARQADFRDFPTAHAGFFCPRVGGRADARELVKRIGVQGEAPVDDRDHPSHFQRFLEIAEGTSPVTAFPRGGWSPAMKVHPVPALSRYRADAREVARAFDKTYAAMLRALRAFFGKPGAKREGAGALLEEQMRDLRRLSRDLVELPPHGGRAASPLFTLPP